MLINFHFIAAVEFIESQTKSFSRANREGENSEQQRLLIQAVGGTGQTQASHIQGENPDIGTSFYQMSFRATLQVATDMKVYISYYKHCLRWIITLTLGFCVFGSTLKI